MTYQFAKQQGVLILMNAFKQLYVLIHAHTDADAIAEIRRYFNQELHIFTLSSQRFTELLPKLFGHSNAKAAVENLEEDLDLNDLVEHIAETAELLDDQNDAPIIRLMNALFIQAIKSQASDIHIETYAKNMIVRFRIDGVLRDILQPRRALAPFVTSRIKVMAKLDIAEKRLPQDGRISLSIGGHNIDVRVSTLPSNDGERIVLRILDKNTIRLDLNDLGMNGSQLDLMKELIQKPHGIILVTGPTGSGKTTTLYAVLSQLNEISRNILTVEDPIEFDLPGIGQTAVNPKVEMTFARGLRAILRQDPDVVMVGEIRDVETAEIAVQASLTGHLVLSTLHTNTAIGAITRLRDMGIEPFLIASSLVGVIAQRLIRLLCQACKEAYQPSAEECQLLNIKPTQLLYRDVGCKQCDNLGYRGRAAIYEIIPIDDTLKQSIHENYGEQQMINTIRETYPSLLTNAYQQVIAGNTTLTEIIRVTGMQDARI
ncbi:MAG: type II secretion system ATPase GspE [Legionellales bacterium]|nr:type II secretion system ATPase GspE [Legionellales bacterium]